jgi:hypothetical protein
MTRKRKRDDRFDIAAINEGIEAIREPMRQIIASIARLKEIPRHERARLIREIRKAADETIEKMKSQIRRFPMREGRENDGPN